MVCHETIFKYYISLYTLEGLVKRVPCNLVFLALIGSQWSEKLGIKSFFMAGTSHLTFSTTYLEIPMKDAEKREHDHFFSLWETNECTFLLELRVTWLHGEPTMFQF